MCGCYGKKKIDTTEVTGIVNMQVNANLDEVNKLTCWTHYFILFVRDSLIFDHFNSSIFERICYVSLFCWSTELHLSVVI